MVAGVMVLGGRVGWLTLAEGAGARLRADGNRVEMKRLPAPRGIIYDRNGEAVTRNVPGAEPDKIKREYSDGVSLAHLLGYVGESGEELGRIEGMMGVEKWQDDKLRGSDGAEIIETGADGSILRKLGRSEPVAGETVKLTVDGGLQRRIMAAMGGRTGAVVVSVPDTGEILGLVSSPSFDPGRVSEFINDEASPMFNRATAGLYPPGSVFKLVTAVAGLEEGKLTGLTEIEDTGEIRVGEFRYGNWYFDQYGRKEGRINIVKALGRSNDIFFYQVGQMVGAQGLADWAKRLGLGESLALGWAAEASGLVPDPAWKETVKGERWFLGNTYHMAIGQGDLGVTPLQINMLTGAIGNGGKLCKPQIIFDDQFSISNNCGDLRISQETLELISQGMVTSCATGGVAFPLFDFIPSVACKTGTAQHGGEETLPHAWITVLAPVDNPEVAVTVLLEAAGEGSYEAAPVAREILEYWFHQRR